MMKKRILALLLAIVMIFVMMPVSVFATALAESDHSVTVGFTVVDCLEHNVERMRKELTVTPGLALEYFPDGQYGSSVGMTIEVGENDVTPIDVLVAAHLDAYGDAFAENPGDYIGGFDYATKMFGASSEITWTANGIMPYAESEYGNMGYAINQYVVQNGDEICFYRMSFYATPGNVYASFDQVEAEVKTGEELTLRLGYCATMDYYDSTFAAANTEIFYLNEDGTLGDSTGLTTDENGNVTVSFAEAGTYYLTCKGEVEYADMMGNSTSALSPACVKVTVKDAAVAVESVTLDKSELTLEIGATENLTATVKPDNATDKTVTWESSDPAIATVENGVVTAVAAGEATITAKAGDKEAICTVTVNAPAPNPNVIDATIGGTRTSPSNIAYIDKITVGDTVSVKESSFDGLTANIVLAPGTAPDATFDFAFSYVHTMPQMTDMFDIAFDSSSDVNEDGTGTVTLEDGGATAIVTVIATLPQGKQSMNWTLNFTTALDTTNNVIDATIGGTRTSPSNIAYIDKITVGDTVSVKESSFDGLTANIVLAPGTAPDATFDFAFSYVHTMPQMTDMFDIAFDSSSDVNEDGVGTVTLEDGGATAIVTVIATLPQGKQNMNWTLNFTTASGGSSGGGNKNAIPVEAKGLLYGDLYIGIQQFLFRDCKVLDYNWADDYTLNVYVSDATADDGTLSIMYNMLFANGSEIDLPSPYTVQLDGGKATVKYNITPKGAYDRPENAHAAHTITVNITNKGLTLPALAEGLAEEVDASAKLGETFALNLNEIFRDAESDPMTYSVNIDSEGAADADAQYSFTAPTVGEFELVFKAHDGMNWSTATYTVKLSVTDDKEPYTFTAKVPDAVTPTFSATKGFREDGTDIAGTPLTATKGESKDGWTAYTVEVPGSVNWVSVRGTDGTNDWGGMAFAVEENAVITLRQVNAVINSKIVLDNVESYPTADQAVFKVEYADDVSSRYAVSGSTFTDDYGYPGYRFLLVAADNSLVYTYYAEPLGEVAKHYSTNVGVTKTITTDSASVVTTTLPLGTQSAFAITAPVDAKVQMFSQSAGNYYGSVEIPAFDTKENGDGTKTVTFNGVSRMNSYRVSMEGKITKAGYVSGDGVTVTWDGDDRGPNYRRAYDFGEDGYYMRADDSILVNVNYRNNLLLDEGETFTLRSYRIWQIINNDTQNVMIEPDFHINVLSGSDVISVSEYPDYHGNGTGNRMNITALKEGTAILEVTYDAIEILEREVGSGEISGMGGLTFNACDPTRTALIVVQVGAEDSDVNFGIVNNGSNNWDSEFDTLYFLGDQGQLELKPTVDSGSIAQVAVSNDKGASWTVLTGEDGAYTADIIPGNNLIRITKADGTVSYQLVRGDKISYTVTERSDVEGADCDGIIEAGEPVSISFTGQHVPFGKMAGIYNPWNWYTRYDFEGTTTKGGAGMYTYAHYSRVFLTIPEDAQPGDVYTLTNGYSELGTAFGSGGGGHRNAGDVVPPSLDAPDSVPGTFNIFPDITIKVGDNAVVEEKVPVESVTLDKTTAELEAGKTLKLTATVNPSNATEKTVTWTSSNENVATVENGVVTAVAEGSATITVTTKDGGKVATCVVTVKKAAEDNDPQFGIPADEIVGYVTVSFEDFGIRVEGEDIDSAYASARGVIIPATKVPFKAYDTIASVTLRLLKAKGYTASYTGNEFGGFYLSAINGFGEFDAGSGSGWMVTLNGWFINKGASEFTVQDGDTVKWQYTCQLGKDIGDSSYYKSVEDVVKLIDAIGTVTLQSEQAIEKARAAYNKLSAEDKKRVSNYAELTAAEATLAALKKQNGEEDQTTAAGEDIYKTTGDYLENLGTPVPGSVGGEWMVIGLLRSDRKVQGSDAYYDAAVKFVQENIDENERLHSAKSTENSRMILALTAMGKDVTDVGGHNLLRGLNDMQYIRKQGLNGPIWALIALDSGNYPVPEGDVTREALIQVILDAQLTDGGWALSGSVSDPDITGMALQALVPYYKTNAKVKAAVDTAITALSKMQAADGSYASIDGTSSESISQVIVALAALGIDADKDARFIKNGVSALDALCAFYVEGGGFRHIPTGKLDGMATEQGYYALTAYFRMLDGKNALYDMTDVVDLGGDQAEEEPTETLPAETEPAAEEDDAKGGFPWWLLIVIVVLAGAVVVLVIVSKLKKRG